MLTLRPYQQAALSSLQEAVSQSTEPLLVTASVGAGKSLLIAAFLLSYPGRALCLTMNSELIRNNAQAYRNQGGECGIYCAGLVSRETSQRIIFASPHSALADIRTEGPLSKQSFDIIVVDEAHNISLDYRSMYIRIFNHFKSRVIGLTGTPYRGKSESIVGPNAFFKKEVCNISTSYLIKEGFLVKPIFGLPSTTLDFSKCKVQSNGRFSSTELQTCADERLTAVIMRDVIEVVRSGRNGAFIFAATIQHAQECMRSLPPNESALIIGETLQSERMKYLDAARNGGIKYLVNVNCLTVGVDIPNYDVCAWLRPTESLVLYTQGIGRVLRLHPTKLSACVLDYAGNLDRHGDVDDPIINQAIQPKEGDPEYCIPCYTCGCLNSIHARRCIGLDGFKRRCNHYFNFKPCHRCEIENDITAKYCRACSAELIDPNSKLRLLPNQSVVIVTKIQYHISQTIFAIYYNGSILEQYHLTSTKALNFFYANFVKKYVDKPSKYYMHLRSHDALKDMCAHVLEPSKLVMEDGKIKKKIFE